MVRKRLFPIALCLVGFLGNCSKNTLSDRDLRLEQLRNAAEMKRRELMLVSGDYQGLLTQSSGPSQNVLLHLEIKDIPTPVEGFVDPIMTPVLTGFLRFNFAGGGDPEYIGFAVERAEFDPKREKLDLVLNHSDYKDLIISMEYKDPTLSGSWTAPAVAASGEIRLQKASSNPAGEELRGEYGGILFREGDFFQWGHLSVQTSFRPPEGLKVSATLRIIFGDWLSTEYLTYKFDPVQFNPVNGQIVFKGTGLDVILTGHWGSGEISGEWLSSYTGKMGMIRFKKNAVPPEKPTGTLFEALRGTYQGELKNTHPQSNLPERVMVSFVTSQDLTQPNGIQITGNIRFYLGPFGSLEYVEMPLSDIQHNFFTKKLVAKTSGEYKLTIKADVTSRVISGNLFSDALGEVATVELIKQ